MSKKNLSQDSFARVDKIVELRKNAEDKGVKTIPFVTKTVDNDGNVVAQATGFIAEGKGSIVESSQSPHGYVFHPKRTLAEFGLR